MADRAIFSNNCRSTLAGAITDTATTCNLAAGTGSLFPNPGAGEYFDMTFTDAATGLVNEIVHVTIRSGDALTMVRAQEGTAALPWDAGDLAQGLITAGFLNDLLQDAVEGVGRYLGTLVVTVTDPTVDLITGTTSVIVEGIGGGGGAGAVPITSGGETAGSGGGGSGAWGKVFVDTDLTTLAATIGAAGAGGVHGVSSGVGGTGGNTIFTGDFGTITFPGGVGSVEGVILTVAGLQGGGAGGALASQSGGTPWFLTAGVAGDTSIVFSGMNAESGQGSPSPYGAGGAALGATGAGVAASGYGAGGGGALNLPSQGTAKVGGVAKQGVLLIHCYSGNS